jgi:hypothetical protein
MLFYAVSAFFLLMAAEISASVCRESAIFSEFGQPTTLKRLVWLFPLAPVIVVHGIGRIGGTLSLILAALCFVPALIAARRLIAAFERAGTDRVEAAESAAGQAVTTVIAGISFVVVGGVFVVASNSY